MTSAFNRISVTATTTTPLQLEKEVVKESTSGEIPTNAGGISSQTTIQENASLAARSKSAVLKKGAEVLDSMKLVKAGATPGGVLAIANTLRKFLPKVGKLSVELTINVICYTCKLIFCGNRMETLKHIVDITVTGTKDNFNRIIVNDYKANAIVNMLGAARAETDPAKKTKLLNIALKSYHEGSPGFKKKLIRGQCDDEIVTVLSHNDSAVALQENMPNLVKNFSLHKKNGDLVNLGKGVMTPDSPTTPQTSNVSTAPTTPTTAPPKPAAKPTVFVAEKFEEEFKAAILKGGKDPFEGKEKIRRKKELLEKFEAKISTFDNPEEARKSYDKIVAEDNAPKKTSAPKQAEASDSKPEIKKTERATLKSTEALSEKDQAILTKYGDDFKKELKDIDNLKAEDGLINGESSIFVKPRMRKAVYAENYKKAQSFEEPLKTKATETFNALMKNDARLEFKTPLQLQEDGTFS